ncbi:MAG TPA: cbb3-type cytochrome c oxidase subunit I [Gemmatimonadales bacterium]|jgi:cbb3-type cytochrome oxidase subunit 1
MPRLSVWMLRLSLLALCAAGVHGALLLSQFPPALALAGRLRAVHIELMLFGWMVQFVLGVAYWILPRHPAPPERGSPALGWTAFGLFQTGLTVAVAGAAAPSGGVLAPAGQLLVVAALLLFVRLLAPRIKPFGSS